MFIKEAYDRRQKMGEGETDILTTEQRIHKIGSIKNHKIHYDKDEQFFSKDEVPQRALDIKEEVLTFVDPDILGLRKKEWNGSVSVPKNPLSEETHERKLVKIRLGLFDHPIPKEKANKIYVGVETRDNYLESLVEGKKWNVSHEIDQKQCSKDLLNFTQKAQSINKNREADIIRNYIKPIETQTLITNNLRRQKSQEKELRDQIRDEFQLANPAASREAIDGAVFRIAYEHKIRQNQQQIQDKNYTFKPDMTRTLRQDLMFKFMHTGVWQKMPDGNNGWSCCMNGEQDSRGCVTIKIDKNKWDYSSFTH